MKRATRLKRNVTPFYPAAAGGQKDDEEEEEEEDEEEERKLKNYCNLRNYIINTVHLHEKQRVM